MIRTFNVTLKLGAQTLAMTKAACRRPTNHYDLIVRSFSVSNDDTKDKAYPTREEIDKERAEILKEASFLTRSLYRICIKCTHYIREGNKYDEEEFKRREDEQFDSSKRSSLTMLSMLPPVDRKDELESRSNYYAQYAHENFKQESDIFRGELMESSQVARYLYFLRRGEKDRKWLLNDMKFEDKYEGRFDTASVNAFEKRALEHVERVRNYKLHNDPRYAFLLQQQRNIDELGGYDSDSDWSDDEK